MQTSNRVTVTSPTGLSDSPASFLTRFIGVNITPDRSTPTERINDIKDDGDYQKTLVEIIRLQKMAFAFELSKINPERLARVEAMALRVFGSPEKAEQWLNNRNKFFDMKPLLKLNTERGTEEVIEIMGAIEFGLPG